MKKTVTDGARKVKREAAPSPKMRGREPRIIQADFDAAFARMDARLVEIEAINERVARKLGA